MPTRAIPARVFCALFMLSGICTPASARQATPNPASLFRRCGLIAHIRVAGELTFPEQAGGQKYIVEIFESAIGPPKGQFVLLNGSSTAADESLKYKPGEQCILFAERKPDGTFMPLEGEFGKWAIDGDGQLAEHPYQALLIPPHAPQTLDGVMAHLWNECRQFSCHIRVSVNQDAVREFAQDKPFPAQIEIQNTGSRPLSFQNDIEYDFRPIHALGRRERLKQLQRLEPHVRLYLQPLGHRLSIVAESLRQMRLARSLTLKPGEICTATYDLADEYGLHGGERYQLWAELGGRRSAPVVFSLEHVPAEAIEELEAVADLDNGGPFKKAVGGGPLQPMPTVLATELAEIVNVALNDWLSGGVTFPAHLGDEETGTHNGKARPKTPHKEPRELVMLRHQNLPVEFAPRIAGSHTMLCDLRWRTDGEPVELNTSQGRAIFNWRVVQIDAVEIDGLTATLKVSQNRRHNLGGSGVTYRLRRERGQWRIVRFAQLWRS